MTLEHAHRECKEKVAELAALPVDKRQERLTLVLKIMALRKWIRDTVREQNKPLGNYGCL